MQKKKVNIGYLINKGLLSTYHPSKHNFGKIILSKTNGITIYIGQ